MVLICCHKVADRKELKTPFLKIGSWFDFFLKINYPKNKQIKFSRIQLSHSPCVTSQQLCLNLVTNYSRVLVKNHTTSKNKLTSVKVASDWFSVSVGLSSFDTCTSYSNYINNISNYIKFK